MVLAIGFRVRGVRGTQFWQWVDQQDEEELRQLESDIKATTESAIMLPVRLMKCHVWGE